MKTLIRLLLQEQSDLGLHCLSRPIAICPKTDDHYCNLSDFIWDFEKLPFKKYLGKYLIKIGKISAKIHKIGKIKAIFGLGMTPI